MKPRGSEFEQIITTDPNKSWFDLSYKNKFTANFGKLYPFYRAETMPGDRFKVHSNLFSRLMPLLAPVMQNVDIFSYFFYVPNRITWPQWKKFASNGDGSVKMTDADSYVPPTHPYVVPFDYLMKIFSFEKINDSYSTASYDKLDFDILKDAGVDLNSCICLSLGEEFGGVFPAFMYLAHCSDGSHSETFDSQTFTPYSADDYHRLFQLFDYLGCPCNFVTKPIDVFNIEDGNYTDPVHYDEVPILCDGVVDYTTEQGGVIVFDSFEVRRRFSLFAPPLGSRLKFNEKYLDESNRIGQFTQLSEVVDVVFDPDIDYINAFPFKAYERIWNEYFRSQDYQDELDPIVVDGLNSASSLSPFILQSKCYEHDYFTSILPDAQRGPDVTLSLAGTARLVNDSSNFSAHPTQIRGAEDTARLYLMKQQGNNNAEVATTGATTTRGTVQFDITGHTKVDLTGVSAITINALRYANTLQRYEEALARSGSRYNEMLISIYGVVSSDASIQRPIFIGASRTPVQVSDVAQTSEGSDTPLATLAGRAIAVGDTFTDFYAEEFGWIIGVCAVVPRTQYYQGLDRHLRKFVNLDYPIPMFANLGEQEVLKSELYANGEPSDKGILGYLPRYSEFKYQSDEIHGALKGSLKYWTMARTLQIHHGGGAIIDADFLRADTHDYDAFAYVEDTDDHFIIECDNKAHVERSLPEYSIPHL